MDVMRLQRLFLGAAVQIGRKQRRSVFRGLRASNWVRTLSSSVRDPVVPSQKVFGDTVM